ncbi:MAG: HepT-like ribonuclease domain-containing protein [Thermodesulfobacteriota bacterium]
MRKDDVIRIRHMLEAGQKAVAFAAGGSRVDLDEDDMFAFALMKGIEGIGEAAGKVSTASKERFDEIPWQQIVGMRGRLKHAYDDISLDILWHTVTDNLPPLLRAVEKIVDAESPE